MDRETAEKEASLVLSTNIALQHVANEGWMQKEHDVKPKNIVRRQLAKKKAKKKT
jgi:hypothetical protein